MSGEAGGLILLTLSVGALPIVGMVLVGGAVAAGIGAATNAAAKHGQKKRREREEIRRSGINESIGSFRNSLAANMNEQMRLNTEASNKMMQEMERNRQELLKLVNENDPEKYQHYMGQIRQSHQELSYKLSDIQESFVKNYHAKINESMEHVTNVINAQYANYLQELQQYQADLQAKKKKAMEIADEYIGEAKVLLAALEEDYDGNKFANLQLIDLQKTLNDTIEQYNSENYEAAIATAKGVSLDTIEEIYKADCKKQEWDNYYKLALTLSAELEAYMSAQEVITSDVKKQVEQRIGKPLEEEIVGIRICDYTDKMKNGKSQFTYLQEKACEIKTYLESQNAGELSTQQLKGYVELLNGKLYPSAQLAIYKGVLNMNNAFSRQNISEEIIDFFEEHNFNFTGYSYDGNQHDGALHIGLENDVTGEEIIVTLAPELMENGDVQTSVEINQLKGDETNEERKAYFRTSVESVVVENTPGAQVHLECKKETKNKLSQKTELRDRLKV